MAKDFTLETFYDLWREYVDHIREAVAPLTVEQAALRPAPEQRSIGEIVAHIIAGRTFWLGDFIGETGDDLDALHRWNDPGALTTDVAALVSGLDQSWRFVANLLDRWTPEDMRQTFPHEWRGNHYELSRSWVVWNVLKHDLHHGGELSLALACKACKRRTFSTSKKRIDLPMPIFVHLAPANAVPRIRRAGIKRGRLGVFCMPMLPNYYTTHQWARELKRRGHRMMLAISFWLDDEELVSAGFYNSSHETMSASEAVKVAMKLKAEYRLGYEVIVPRAIGPREIRAVRSVPHALGWRYFPLAHGVASCTCDWCSCGEIKRQRNKRYQDKRNRQRQRSVSISS